MTIGIFTDTYDSSVNSVSSSARALYESLTSHGHMVYIITSGGNSKKVIQEKNIIKIPDLPLRFISNLRMIFFYLSVIKKLIKNLKLDLIHIEEGYSIAYLGKLCGEKLHLPIVFTTHHNSAEITTSVKDERKVRKIKAGIENTTHQILSDNGEIITHDASTRKLMKEVSPSTYVNCFPEPSESSDSPDPVSKEEYYQNTIYVYEKAIRKNY